MVRMYRTNNSLKLIVACKNATKVSVLSYFNQFNLN